MKPLMALPALIPIAALESLWIGDIDTWDSRWVMVTAKSAQIRSRPWFGLDRAELARVLFP